MTVFFLIAAVVTIAGTAAAMSLRNPIHCILALTGGLVGLAGLYLELGAQFVGFTQVLVYVGAVAILAVFAIMMTRGAEGSAGLLAEGAFSSSWLQGVGVAVVVFVVLAWAMRSGLGSGQIVGAEPVVQVNEIGDALMHRFALPLEIVGLLLTTALIGAVIVAMPEKRSPR
jgi:NADH-quinone oxidoreductase subunit J